MAGIGTNTRSHTKDKIYMMNSQFLQDWEVKMAKRMSKIRLCKGEKSAEGIFCCFFLRLKIWKVGQKSFFFSDFISKRENNYIFQNKNYI